MTEEQFKRAVEINNRLRELNDTKEEIKDTQSHRLSYSYRSSGEYRLCPDWKMSTIGNLLDKHDKMIREEIDEEIRRLQEEIKGL